MNNSTEMTALLSELGLDNLDPDSMCDSGGFADMSQIENPTSAIRSVTTGFGEKQLCLVPFWMKLPFNIATGEKYPRGKFVTSIQMKASPDKIVHIICDMAEADPAYKERVCKILNPKKPDLVVLQYNKETGEFHPKTFRAFAGYLNLFAHTEPVQKFTNGPSTSIVRKALIPMNEYGLPNFEAAPPELLSCYKIESLLMNQLLATTQEKMTRDNESAKKIEDAMKEIRRQRIISSPRMLTVVLAFTFKSSSGGEVVSDVVTKVSSPDYNIAYNLSYFSAYSDTIKAINSAKDASDYPHLSYIPIIRSVPEKSDQVTNLGQAATQTTFTSIGNRDELKPENQLPDIASKINTVMEADNMITIERLKGSVAKYQPMPIPDAMACYRNCAPLYAAVLRDPVFVESNRKLLASASADLGLASIIPPMREDTDVTTITAAFKNIPDEDMEDADVLCDSEDLANGANDALPSDFVKQNA